MEKQEVDNLIEMVSTYVIYKAHNYKDAESEYTRLKEYAIKINITLNDWEMLKVFINRCVELRKEEIESMHKRYELEHDLVKYLLIK